MIYIYTDASFRNTDKVGVIGFLIYENEAANIAGHLSNLDCHETVITETNNIRCEFRAILAAMRFVLNRDRADEGINIFTDCQAITQLNQRRAHLAKNQYQSQRSGSLLANADLYQEFFSLYDQLKPDIYWVKGHAPSHLHGPIQKNFSRIDQAVRQHLRSIPLSGSQLIL